MELVAGEYEWIYEKYRVTHLIHGDDWDPEQYIDHMGREVFNKYNLQLIFIPHTHGINSMLIRQHRSYLDGIKACVIDISVILNDDDLSKGSKELIHYLKKQHKIVYFSVHEPSKVHEYLILLEELGLASLTVNDFIVLDTKMIQQLQHAHHLKPNEIMLISNRCIEAAIKNNCIFTLVLIDQNSLQSIEIIVLVFYAWILLSFSQTGFSWIQLILTAVITIECIMGGISIRWYFDAKIPDEYMRASATGKAKQTLEMFGTMLLFLYPVIGATLIFISTFIALQSLLERKQLEDNLRVG